MPRKSGLNKTAMRVLAFDLHGTLLASFCSLTAASKIVKVSAPSILSAIRGISMQSSGFIWIYEDTNVEIEQSDLGCLKLSEYDKLCGVTREYLTPYKIKKIKNKRL